MSYITELLNGADVVKSVDHALDTLFTSGEEALEQEIERMRAERRLDLLAAAVTSEQDQAPGRTNTDARHSGHLFIAGWRPVIGWIGVIALLYQVVLYPLLHWLPIDNPPDPLTTEVLFSIVTGTLGIGALRSYDKLKGIDTKQVGWKKTPAP